MRSTRIAFVVGSVVFLAASSSRAATLFVGNDGTDSGTCGAQSTPCRSIGQAITNASTGDTIVVGPGTYGDITGTQNFVLPGAEMSVSVDKAVTVESSHGAEATLIQQTLGVDILAGGVVFGRPGKGFTMSGANGGIRFHAGTTGSSAAGNVLHGVADIDGSAHSFEDNRMEGERDSFVRVRGTNHSVQHNIVSAFPSLGNGGGWAFEVSGSGHSLTGNFALSKGGAVSVADGAFGVAIQGNVVVGNSMGVTIGVGATATVTGNNIFANAVVDSPINCGLQNFSGGAIDATHNYWGAASGPGPEPADEVCDGPGSTTSVSPFATQPFPISLPGRGGSGGNGNPVCTAAQAVPTTLWPANGQFTRVWIIGIGDPESDPVSVSISAVTQDEPTSGMPMGDTGPDAVLLGSSVDLRAQRDAGGNGRVYRVQFTASDGNGGTCTGTVTAGVPNNQKPGQAIVDDGLDFDSTRP